PVSAPATPVGVGRNTVGCLSGPCWSSRDYTLDAKPSHPKKAVQFGSRGPEPKFINHLLERFGVIGSMKIGNSPWKQEVKRLCSTLSKGLMAISFGRPRPARYSSAP